MAAILSQYSTTGFYKAPVSKGLLGCMFLTSCALNVPLLAHIKQYVVYNVPSIIEKYEVWRVITSKVTFLDTKDLVCGSLLIYYFRIFERRYGSHKFSSYLMAACTVATFLELAAVFLLRRIDVDIAYLPTGPYGLIFPLFVNYFLDIPRVAQTYIMGVPVTGKTLTYLLGLQVISTNKGSMVTGICCLLAGVICRWNIFRVQNIIQIPNFLARVANATLGYVLRSSPPQEGVVPMGATLEIQRQQQLELLEQQMLLNRAREFRERGNVQSRQQMAQGYAERLVPPGDGGIFGNFQGQDVWDNAFNLRHRRPNISQDTNAEESPVIHEPVEPDGNQPVQEEQVQTLVEMGFDRQSVVRALRSSNNDINLATTILLNES